MRRTPRRPAPAAGAEPAERAEDPDRAATGAAPAASGDWRAIDAILAALCGAQVAWIVATARFFAERRYLPTPFFANAYDTFMDLFNPLFWAFHTERFTEWGSVYPPIDFIALQAFWRPFHGFAGTPPNYTATTLRDLGVQVEVAVGAVALLLASIALRLPPWGALPRRTRLLAAFGLLCGGPVLVGLERGNLVVLCPVLIAVVLADPARARNWAIALLANVKPYGILVAGVFAARRDAKATLRTAAAAAALFFATTLLFDREGLRLFANLTRFGHEAANVFTTQGLLSFPSSVTALRSAFDCGAFVDAAGWGRRAGALRALGVALDGLKWACLAAAAGVLVARGRRLPYRAAVALVVVAMTNLGTWVGGYSLVYDVPLVPVLARMRFRVAYVALVALLFAPLDLITLLRMPSGVPTQHVFLSHATVPVEWRLGAGAILRPLINLALLALLTVECALGEPRVPASETAPALREEPVAPG